MKKILAVLLSVILLLGAFGACAFAEETAKWDTTKKDEIILSVMNNYYTEGWYNAAKKYMELHPETTVTIDVVANNDALSQKFTTWFASDDLSDASDITHINFGNIRSMQEKGQCYDFSQILDEINPYTGKAVRDCFEEADIKTYTNEGAVVADICAGSGTTAVAAMNTSRRFICFENAPSIYTIAAQRIEQARLAMAGGGKGE